MEQKIYDVLCDIRTELSKLRSEMADVKLELENIQGDEDDKVNLCGLYEELTDIRSDINDFKEEYEKRMELLVSVEDDDEGAIPMCHDRLVSIEMDVAAIKSIIED